MNRVETFKEEFGGIETKEQEGVWVNQEDTVALLGPDVEIFGGKDLDNLSTEVENIEHVDTNMVTMNLYKFISESNETFILGDYLRRVVSILDASTHYNNLTEQTTHHEEHNLYPVHIHGDEGWSCLIAGRVQH